MIDHDEVIAASGHLGEGNRGVVNEGHAMVLDEAIGRKGALEQVRAAAVNGHPKRDEATPTLVSSPVGACDGPDHALGTNRMRGTGDAQGRGAGESTC